VKARTRIPVAGHKMVEAGRKDRLIHRAKAGHKQAEVGHMRAEAGRMQAEVGHTKAEVGHKKVGVDCNRTGSGRSYLSPLARSRRCLLWRICPGCPCHIRSQILRIEVDRNLVEGIRFEAGRILAEVEGSSGMKCRHIGEQIEIRIRNERGRRFRKAIVREQEQICNRFSERNVSVPFWRAVSSAECRIFPG